MQPVVGVVDRNEVHRALMVDHQAVDEQHQIDGTAADQVTAGRREGARQRDAGDTEGQMYEIVQDRHIEDTQQGGLGMVACEGQLVVVRGETRYEPEDSDQQDHHPDGQ